MKEVGNELTTAFTHNSESGKKKRKEMRQHFSTPLIISVSPRSERGEREDVWYLG